MGPLEPQPVLLASLQLSLPVPVFLPKEQPVSLARARPRRECPLPAAVLCLPRTP